MTTRNNPNFRPEEGDIQIFANRYGQRSDSPYIDGEEALKRNAEILNPGMENRD
jgi:hypothetical protein